MPVANFKRIGASAALLPWQAREARSAKRE
jgi:hypothetical protein